jgi:type II secretory pathway component GspD/PulD (secretin)
MKAVYTIVLALLSLLSAPAYPQSLTIIDLQHRTADEVLPVLRPLVGSDAALSGIDYRLLVRGSAADVARIREALTVLDRAPKQMLVSVRYATQSQVERESIAVGGRVGVQNGDASGQLTLRAGRGSDSRDGGNVSSVRVTEGQAAYIASGERVPFVSAVSLSPRHAGAIIEERQLSSGFQVQPRINGNAVILEVGAQQEQRQGGAIATHSVNTSVMGKLGEWLALGGVDETTQSSSSGIGSKRIETASDRRQMWIKVELIDN